MRGRSRARTLGEAWRKLSQARRALSGRRANTSDLDTASRALDEAVSLMGRAADSSSVGASDAVIVRSAQTQAREALDRIEETHEELQRSYTRDSTPPRPKDIRRILETGKEEADQKAASSMDILRSGGRNTREAWADRALRNPANIAIAGVLTAAIVATVVLDAGAFFIAAACIATAAHLLITVRSVVASGRLDNRAIDAHAAAGGVCIPAASAALAAAGAGLQAAAFLGTILILWAITLWLAARWRILGQ